MYKLFCCDKVNGKFPRISTLLFIFGSSGFMSTELSASYLVTDRNLSFFGLGLSVRPSVRP